MTSTRLNHALLWSLGQTALAAAFATLAARYIDPRGALWLRLGAMSALTGIALITLATVLRGARRGEHGALALLVCQLVVLAHLGLEWFNE